MNHFVVFKKYLSDYNCKIYEALLIKKYQSKLNKQFYKNNLTFFVEGI